MLWALSFPSPRGVRRSEYKGCQALQAAVGRQSRKRSIRWVVFPTVGRGWVLSHFSHVQVFAALWTVAHQASLPMGFSRKEHWKGLPSPPRDRTQLSCFAGRFHLSHHGSLRVAAGKLLSRIRCVFCLCGAWCLHWTTEILLYCQWAATDHRWTHGCQVAIKLYLQKRAVSRMWLTGQWFTESCPSQLSTALTLWKACEDSASQLTDGFAGSI